MYEYTIYISAYDSQVRFVLLEKKEDKASYLIGYLSHMLTNAKQKLQTTRKGCLDVIWAVLLLKSYSGRICFIISSSKVTLKWLLTSADVSEKLARWFLLLFQFDIEVVHRAGIKQQARDGS